MNIFKKIGAAAGVIFTSFIFAPALAFAQANFNNSTVTSGATTLSQTSTLNDLVAKIIGFFNVAVYLIVALAILTFVWNIYHYFITNDPENKKEGGKYVMYSVLGIFIILSFWGLVNIISNTLNINSNPGSVNVGSLIGNITGNGSNSSGSNFNNSSLFGTGTGGASSGGATANSGVVGANGGTVSSANLAAMQANFQANCTNSAGQPILISSNCQTLSSQIQSAQTGSGSNFSNSSGDNNGGCASDETVDQFGDCINNAFLYGDDSSSGSGSGSGGSSANGGSTIDDGSSGGTDNPASGDDNTSTGANSGNEDVPASGDQ